MAIIRNKFKRRPAARKFVPSPNAKFFDKEVAFCVEVRPRCKFSSTLMRFQVGGRSDEEVRFKAVQACCEQFRGQMLDNPDEWDVVSASPIKQMKLF